MQMEESGVILLPAYKKNVDLFTNWGCCVGCFVYNFVLLLHMNSAFTFKTAS